MVKNIPVTRIKKIRNSKELNSMCLDDTNQTKA
jgi:hypothetical protein